MARCRRCNRFMLFQTVSGYCKDCDILNAKAEEERQRKAEEERRRQEEARKAEEERRRREEARKAEEERRRQEEARRAEEERRRREENYKRIEEEAIRKRRAATIQAFDYLEPKLDGPMVGIYLEIYESDKDKQHFLKGLLSEIKPYFNQDNVDWEMLLRMIKERKPVLPDDDFYDNHDFKDASFYKK